MTLGLPVLLFLVFLAAALARLGWAFGGLLLQQIDHIVARMHGPSERALRDYAERVNRLHRGPGGSEQAAVTPRKW